MSLTAPQTDAGRPTRRGRPTRSAARLAAVIGIPAALIISGVVVSQASYSAYSSATENPTSNWSSGTVKLADDDANAALFTATNLKPGQTASKCIVVTSSGSLPSAVKVYGTSAATTNGLSSAIDLVVTQGSGGSFSGSCTGFAAQTTGSSVYTGTLAGFGSAATNFSTGLGSWTTTGAANETKTYKIDYTLNASTTNTTQAGTAALAFTWEAQNV